MGPLGFLGEPLEDKEAYTAYEIYDRSKQKTGAICYIKPEVYENLTAQSQKTPEGDYLIATQTCGRIRYRVDF